MGVLNVTRDKTSAGEFNFDMLESIADDIVSKAEYGSCKPGGSWYDISALLDTSIGERGKICEGKLRLRLIAWHAVQVRRAKSFWIVW